jgi:hypothetical protein
MGRLKAMESPSIQEQNETAFTTEARERFLEILGAKVGYQPPMFEVCKPVKEIDDYRIDNYGNTQMRNILYESASTASVFCSSHGSNDRFFPRGGL